MDKKRWRADEYSVKGNVLDVQNCRCRTTALTHHTEIRIDIRETTVLQIALNIKAATETELYSILKFHIGLNMCRGIEKLVIPSGTAEFY